MAYDYNSYVKKTEGTADRFLPIVQASFHTETACYKARGTLVGLEGTPDPTDQLLSGTTQKAISNPAGAFTLTLAGDSWITKIKSNDLAIIYMGEKTDGTVKLFDGTLIASSEDMSTVMIGLIDTVQLTKSISGNQPVVNTSVTGRDFGKILIKAMLRFYPEIGWDKPNDQKFFLTNDGWITLMKAFTNENAIKGTPAKIVDTILRFILQQIIDIKWNVYDDNALGQGTTSGKKTVGLANILRYRLAQVNMFIPMLQTAQQFEGSVWNLIERVCTKPFVEVFLDTRDRWDVSSGPQFSQIVNETVEEGSTSDKASPVDIPHGKWAYPATMFGKKDGAQAVLVLRNTPFDKASWEKLRKHEITDVNVKSQTLALSDNEHYNLFWAGTTITPFSTLDLKRVMPPLINEQNVKRYGLSPLEVTVEGLELKKEAESSQTVALQGLTSSFSAKLKAWYENNHEYLTGSIEVKGKGDYKIGERLLWRDFTLNSEDTAKNIEFYIEGVNQNFQVFTDWTTTLQVTRGMLEGTAPDSSKYIREVPKPVPPAPPVPPSQASPAQIQSRYYTVVSGDTLWGIASKKSIYGDGTKWTRIWEANKAMLITRDKRNASDPGHWIFPAQQLIIP